MEEHDYTILTAASNLCAAEGETLWPAKEAVRVQGDPRSLVAAHFLVAATAIDRAMQEALALEAKGATT